MRNSANTIEIPVNDVKGRLIVKNETMGSTGSLKDRVAYHMIQQAEKRHKLRPGDTIVECTAGNNGIALAHIANNRGYKFVAVVSEGADCEKVDSIRALNAEVVFVRNLGNLDLTSMMMCLRRKALEICRTTNRAIFLDQADSPENPESYLPLGEEIAEKITDIRALLGIVGTGGSLCGTARAVKEKRPSTEIVAVCMRGSPIFAHRALTLRNLLRLFQPPPNLPKNIDYSLIDSHRIVTLKEAVSTCRFLYRQGISAGLLSSATIHEALKMLHEKPRVEGSIVTILGDSAEYLEYTYLDNRWVQEAKLFDGEIEKQLEDWTDFK